MVSYLYMFKIVDYVYICSREKATDLNELENEKIKCMLYLNPKTKNKNVLDDLTEIGIHHYTIKIEDEKDLDFKKYVDRIVKIIHHFVIKKLNVLIYCESGVRLSPIAVVCYILYKTYIVDKNVPTSFSIVPRLLRKIQKINKDIDYQNMDIQQLVTYEISLKK